MKALKCLGLGLVLCLGNAGMGAEHSYPGRQYYSNNWVRYGQPNYYYYYRNYYYQPVIEAPYENQYVIYYPNYPRYYYWYNPYVRRYWGRFDRTDGTYASLEQQDQKQALAEIPDTAFPKGGGMPVIPKSTDSVQIEGPPNELPPAEQALAPKQGIVTKQTIQALVPTQAVAPQQVYSDWCQTYDNSYNTGYSGYSGYYSTYYYQPSYNSTYYSCHTCYYYPSYSSRYIYYYNPYSRRYWGRYDLEQKGYSMLAEKDRKGDLKSIPDSAFPTPGEMPQLPGVTDNIQLSRPPAALPGSEKK